MTNPDAPTTARGLDALAFAVSIALVTGGCGEPKSTAKDQGEASESDTKEGSGGAKVALEKRVFHGIHYLTPAGSNIANSGVDRPSHYPDPQTGQVVEIPTRIEPAISVTGEAAAGFFMVDIKKPPERVTLEGMISSLRQRAEVAEPKGTAETNGWSLTYQWKNADGTSTTMRHRHYALPDSDYDCVYDETNSKDVAAAGAICASIKAAESPKPVNR
ncbi:MAG TPA: hypothetical protein VMZ28_22075 [Kofleriaceae bacterium]|nr:hypothetical protein [Kofleriaceae bacterium]